MDSPAAVARATQAAAGAGIILMVVAATALGRGLTAAPLPNGHAELRTGGLYHFVRHLIYTGLLLFAAARTLTSGSLWTASACVALIVLINAKARWEQRHLAKRFPGYAAYAARTSRFIPGLGRLLAEGIAEAPEGASPLGAVAAGLQRASSEMGPMNRELGPARRPAPTSPRRPARDDAVLNEARN